MKWCSPPPAARPTEAEELVLSQVAGWAEAEGVTHPQDPTLEADTHWLSADSTTSHFILDSMRQQTRNTDFEITDKKRLLLGSVLVREWELI